MNELIQLFILEFTCGLISHRKLKKKLINFLLYTRDTVFTLTKYHSQNYEWVEFEWMELFHVSLCCCVQQDRSKIKQN